MEACAEYQFFGRTTTKRGAPRAAIGGETSRDPVGTLPLHPDRIFAPIGYEHCRSARLAEHG
jgi:hypothetical protein